MEIAALPLVASALALLGAGALLARPVWRRVLPDTAAPSSAGQAVFLFRDSVMIDATPAAQGLLLAAGRQGRSLAAVASFLALQFPALPERLAQRPPALAASATPTEELLAAEEDGTTLRIARWAGFTRLTLAAAEGAPRAHPVPPEAAAHLIGSELHNLRALAEDAPQLIWKEDAAGLLTWANRAYLARAQPQRRDGAPLPWPEDPLFAEVARPQEEGASTSARAALHLPLQGNAPPESLWFEVTLVRRGGQVMGFAADASGAVAAEDGRRTLLQTLTKTFAHLSAGLAIFDRHRRLVLFNPAFLDLTGLRVDFLAQRPLVHSVIDRLHDMQMLPEPRHYASWREQLAALEAAAEEGSYCETWMLPNGATYRVSGRPHTDGALAFLFEDISDETALSRQFRAEQEASQSVIDLLPQALAVFSRGGVMILHNAAYAQLWPADHAPPKGGLVAPHLAQEAARWRRATRGEGAWRRLSHALDLGEVMAEPVTEYLQDGAAKRLQLTVTPLAGGVRQVEFHPLDSNEALAERRPYLLTPAQKRRAGQLAESANWR